MENRTKENVNSTIYSACIMFRRNLFDLQTGYGEILFAQKHEPFTGYCVFVRKVCVSPHKSHRKLAGIIKHNTKEPHKTLQMRQKNIHQEHVYCAVRYCSFLYQCLFVCMFFCERKCASMEFITGYFTVWLCWCWGI